MSRDAHEPLPVEWAEITRLPDLVEENREPGDIVFRYDRTWLPGGAVVDVTFGSRSVPSDAGTVEQFGPVAVRILGRVAGPFLAVESMDALREFELGALIEQFTPEAWWRYRLANGDRSATEFTRALAGVHWRWLDSVNATQPDPDALRHVVALADAAGLPVEPVRFLSRTFLRPVEEIEAWLA